MRDVRLPPRLKWIRPTSKLLRGVGWFQTDVSQLPIGWPLKMGATDSHQTSVLNHLTPRNNPEHGGIQIHTFQGIKAFVWPRHFAKRFDPWHWCLDFYDKSQPRQETAQTRCVRTLQRMKPVPPDRSLFLTTLKNKINLHYTCVLHLYRRQSARGPSTPSSRNRNPQYCFPSEEQNPMRNIPRRIVGLCTNPPPISCGKAGALCTPLLTHNKNLLTSERPVGEWRKGKRKLFVVRIIPNM